MLFHCLALYARVFGGGETGPAGSIENRYLGRLLPPGSLVVDAGGGEGKLARYLSGLGHRVIVLDLEATCLEGADNSIYAGSLRRLKELDSSGRVAPVHGDALSMPFAANSVDAIVSSQFLEHVSDSGKLRFFEEAARCLKPGGVLAISTPDADFIERHHFWFSPLCRAVIPERVKKRLPRSVRGPWLEQTLEQWEAKVGHFDHGCRPARVANYASACGFHQIDERHSHTAVACFWMELMFTSPALFLLASPLARVAYWLESYLPPRPGVNLLARYRKLALEP